MADFTKIVFLWMPEWNRFAPAEIYLTLTTSRMEFFVTLVNGWKSSSDVWKSSILDVAGGWVKPLLFNLKFVNIVPTRTTIKMSS